MTTPLLHGVVVCHGELGPALVTAVEDISGIRGVLVPVSNSGCDRGQLEDRIVAAVDGRPSVVFVDMPSGSCLFAAARRLSGTSGARLVTGVNLGRIFGGSGGVGAHARVAGVHPDIDGGGVARGDTAVDGACARPCGGELDAKTVARVGAREEAARAHGHHVAGGGASRDLEVEHERHGRRGIDRHGERRRAIGQLARDRV